MWSLSATSEPGGQSSRKPPQALVSSNVVTPSAASVSSGAAIARASPRS